MSAIPGKPDLRNKTGDIFHINFSDSAGANDADVQFFRHNQFLTTNVIMMIYPDGGFVKNFLQAPRIFFTVFWEFTVFVPNSPLLMNK